MGFISKRGEGRGRAILLTCRRGSITGEFLYLMFQLSFVLLVTFALFSYINTVASDLDFEKKFTAMDLGMIATTVNYAPGTLVYKYTPILFKTAIDAGFSDSTLIITERGEDILPKKFWILSNKDMDPFTDSISLKGVPSEDPYDNESIPPDITFYRTGRETVLEPQNTNPLHLDCPSLNTTAELSDTKISIISVLPEKSISNTQEPVRRIASILGARISRVKTSIIAGDSKKMPVIDPEQDIIIFIGDSGMNREPGSIVAYIPIDDRTIRSRKLACFIINDLLTEKSTVFYSQVMPVNTAQHTEGPLRVLTAGNNPSQAIAFIDISTFKESQIDVHEAGIAIQRAIMRYLGNTDMSPSRGITLRYERQSQDQPIAGEITDESEDPDNKQDIKQ